jgi:Xaa-Pro aminopeptidase
MKRGLVLLDPAEIPAREWRDRVTALQRELADGGIDVALIYGDVSRADDIAYLTNLCVYWNEGILVVPSHGEPAFLTKLSARVHPWMRLVSRVTEIRSGRSFGELAAKFLGPGDGGTVGLIDAGLWPAVVAAQIREALPDWRVRPLGGLVRARRQVPSGSELALLQRGAGLLAQAAAAATADGLTAAGRIALAERELRRNGFLDVIASTTRTADGVETVQITGQYRYLWLHVSRLTGTGAAAWPSALRRAIGAATAAVSPGTTAAGLDAAIRPLLADLPAGASAVIHWVHQADMATNGEYASYSPDLPMPAGSVVVISIEVRFPSGGYATVAETLLVNQDGTACLTDPRAQPSR